MATERTLTVSQLAAILRLNTKTIDRYANNDQIPYGTTPSGKQRRYNLEEVKAALEAMGEEPIALPARQNGTHAFPGAVDLDAWADRRAAEEELPELVRLLILGSGCVLTRMEVPTGDGVGTPGWDVLVEAVVGTRHVPAGVSVWEMGRDEDIRSKADGDYEKRTGDPLGRDRSQTVFVFVTPRRWPGRGKWEREKNKRKVWKEVRAYDAYSLQDWLDAAPTAQARAARIFGREPEGLKGLAEAWEAWSARTAPPLPPDLLVSGRDGEVQQLRACLDAEPATLWVVADTSDEACGFVLAGLMGLPEDERDSLEARTLVVGSAAAWDDVLARVGADNPHVLIAEFPDPAAARAIGNGHRVIIPTDRNSLTIGNRIGLSRLRREGARRALLEAGLPQQQADELSSLARRSLTVLRRRYAVDGSARPTWAQPESGAELLPAVLIGAWHEDASLDGDRPGPYPADQTAVAEVAARPYAEISALCTGWAAGPDAPVRQEGTLWYCVAKPDAWDLLASLATRDLLRRFRLLAIKVLASMDPTLELEASQRWAAGLYGIAAQWSPQMRASIAETLAVIATSSGDTVLMGSLTGAEYVSEIVREVLDRANADETGRLWPSLGDVLPVLAEAAADPFGAAVDSGLNNGALLAVFDPEAENALFGQPSHTGLLWALEILAWSPEHMGTAAVALAGLAEADPGGRWANRPEGSLRQIFQPVYPQTAADTNVRLAVIDRLRHSKPNASWKLLVRLLPAPFDAVDESSRPRWRDWVPEDRPGVTNVEWAQHTKAIVDRVLEDVGIDGARWADLIERLPNLPLESHRKLLESVRRLDPEGLAAAERGRIADALAKIVREHRRFPDAPWALPSDLLDPIEEQLARFREVQPGTEAAWLFSRRVEIGPWADDHAAEELEIERQRTEAVAGALAADGADGVTTLAVACEDPWLLGYTAGRVAPNIEETLLRLLESQEPQLRALALGYVAGRFRVEGWEWADSQLAEADSWPAPMATTFLHGLPATAATFDWAERLGADICASYWAGLAVLAITDIADREYAVTMLLLHRRATAAVSLLTTIVHDITREASKTGERRQLDPDLIIEALQAARRSTEHGDVAMFIYEVTTLLSYLDSQPGIESAQLAQLEWSYLPYLEHQQRSSRVLHTELASNPEFFVFIVELAYGSPTSDQQGRQPAEQDRLRAGFAIRLLRAWRTLPGSQVSPSLSLSEWVTRARQLLVEKDLGRQGDRHIGAILQYTEADSNGVWPPLEVRDLIEQTQSPQLEEGLKAEVRVSRGMSSRDPVEGGEQERSLAQRYKEYAREIGAAWPRTQRVLRDIARQWNADALVEDQRAAIREDLGP